MQHLWSVATWDSTITHDAGMPEWIDRPLTEWKFDSRDLIGGNPFDGTKCAIQLPQTLHLVTAWYMDELCEDLYLTCIDPRGITLYRDLLEQKFQESIPTIKIAGIPLTRLWYTVDGTYTFTFAYFFGGLPYQHLGSYRFRLVREEKGRG